MFIKRSCLVTRLHKQVLTSFEDIGKLFDSAVVFQKISFFAITVN